MKRNIKCAPKEVTEVPSRQPAEKSSCQLPALYRSACVSWRWGRDNLHQSNRSTTWSTAFSLVPFLPLCKSPNTLFPVASFLTPFDILITQLTILPLRNDHIRNIFFKRNGRNKPNWALSLGSEREKGRGYFSFLSVSVKNNFIYIYESNIWDTEHLRLLTAFKADLTFFTTSGDYEK